MFEKSCGFGCSVTKKRNIFVRIKAKSQDVRKKVLRKVHIGLSETDGSDIAMSRALAKLTVAVPETRQRDLLAQMLQARGAAVLSVPLVAIHDHPDQARVASWLRRFVELPADLLVLLTGEGLRRLLNASERAGLREGFLQRLATVPVLCRGPKPERVLYELGVKAAFMAAHPTTEGVIQTLEAQDLAKGRIAVQLYGDEPNLLLVDFLNGSGANIDTVAPYTYASKAEEAKVTTLISALAAGSIDVLAFTSQGQYKRLKEVARAGRLDAELQKGLCRTVLAAVGPVVRDLLVAEGYRVAIMPERVYFMKPLVAAIERYFHAS